MTAAETVITIVIAAAGTAAIRFLPFIIFPEGKKVPAFVAWLGKWLPRATMAMLLVFCLKDVSFLNGPSGWLPAVSGLAVTIGLHLWKRNMVLSIAAGTALYMILIRVM